MKLGATLRAKLEGVPEKGDKVLVEVYPCVNDALANLYVQVGDDTLLIIQGLNLDQLKINDFRIKAAHARAP